MIMANFTINSNMNNISIKDGKITINGKPYKNEDINKSLDKDITLIVNGDITGNVDICGNLQCGNIEGNVDINGDMVCSEINGDIDSVGNIKIIKGKE